MRYGRSFDLIACFKIRPTRCFFVNLGDQADSRPDPVKHFEKGDFDARRTKQKTQRKISTSSKKEKRGKAKAQEQVMAGGGAVGEETQIDQQRMQ